MTKICSKCKIEKSLDLFHKRKDRVSGIRSKCKECDKQVIGDWRRRNQKEYNEYMAIYRSTRGDKISEYGKKARKKFHKIHGCAPETKRRKENLSYKLISSLRNRLNDAVRNSYKSGSAIDNLGCSIEQLKIHLQSKFQPNMTWENWGKGPGKWQIDHIKPLFKFDLTNIEELKIACNYSNLQPLWHEDHTIKTKLDKNSS